MLPADMLTDRESGEQRELLENMGVGLLMSTVYYYSIVREHYFRRFDANYTSHSEDSRQTSYLSYMAYLCRFAGPSAVLRHLCAKLSVQRDSATSSASEDRVATSRTLCPGMNEGRSRWVSLALR